jgi:peptidoglycan hydrolase-like protein with peptidoglycan-binding domain
MRRPGMSVHVIAHRLGVLAFALAAAHAVGGASAEPAMPPDASPADEAQVPLEDLILDAQRILQGRGFDPGPADGKLGRRTREAIRAYQRTARMQGAADGPTGPDLAHRTEPSSPR